MYYGMSADALQKMYVQNSLRNDNDGFVFEIQNKIDSGTVSGIGKLVVDDEEKPLEEVTVEMSGKVRQADTITWSSSLYVPYGATLKIAAPGTLEPGEHTVKLTVNAPEIGQLTLPITDTIEP